MIDRGDKNEFVQGSEAADRAGAIVTDHVRSIIDAAQSKGDEIERNAREEAETLRLSAHDGAKRILERIDAVEGQLGTLVDNLRKEADQLATDLDGRG